MTSEEDAADIAIYSMPSTCNAKERYHDDISSELWDDFVSSNEFANGPIRLSYLEGIINLVSWEDNVQIYETKTLSKLFRPTPKRLIKLSRAGFNSNQTEALFCMDFTAVRHLFFLEKQNEIWVLKKEYVISVS